MLKYLTCAVVIMLAGCASAPPQAGRLVSAVAWTAPFGSGTSAQPIVFPNAGVAASLQFVESCTGTVDCQTPGPVPPFTLSVPASCTQFVVNAGVRLVDPAGTNTVTALAPGTCTLTATPVDSALNPVSVTVVLH